jgi:CDP-glycerol glycerophosphotransferase (TagB/SpsB family)
VVQALDGVIPAAKLVVYRDNLDFFRSLDALVVAEKTSTILKTRYGLQSLRLIHTRHGAGDRAVGFDKASALFDFVLVSGPKIRDRLVAEAGLPAEKLAVVGYPKFDLPRTRTLPAKLAGNGKPTVLYNPHVSPHLSSWYTHGRAVLDFFVGNPDYNLIFAPHVMLFERKVVISIDKLRLDWPGRLEAKYFDAPNIHIDLGSAASTDMSYTEAADIYLGDVSSQIYEFLIRPRPCIFLNSHHLDYAADPNFAHWAAGTVIGDPSLLRSSLVQAPIDHRSYSEIQRDLFERSIDLTKTSSSERAAHAIRQFLQAPDADAGYLDTRAVEQLFDEHRGGRFIHGRVLNAIAMFSCWWKEQRPEPAHTSSLTQIGA